MMMLMGVILICIVAVACAFDLARRDNTKWGWFQFSLVVVLVVTHILQEIF